MPSQSGLGESTAKLDSFNLSQSGLSKSPAKYYPAGEASGEASGTIISKGQKRPGRPFGTISGQFGHLYKHIQTSTEPFELLREILFLVVVISETFSSRLWRKRAQEKR